MARSCAEMVDIDDRFEMVSYEMIDEDDPETDLRVCVPIFLIRVVILLAVIIFEPL